MTQNTKPRKSPQNVSRKPVRKGYKPSKISQKHVGKSNLGVRVLNHTKTSLSQMVANLPGLKTTRRYEVLAEKLSALAGLNNGHVWGWRYVASVRSGSTLPSRKFVDAVTLYAQNISPRKKQWFYFAYRHAVACVYSKSILADVIKTNMRNMGYKPVTHARYMEIKRRSTRGKYRGYNG